MAGQNTMKTFVDEQQFCEENVSFEDSLINNDLENWLQKEQTSQQSLSEPQWFHQDQSYQHFADTSRMQSSSGPHFQEHPIQIQQRETEQKMAQMNAVVCEEDKISFFDWESWPQEETHQQNLTEPQWFHPVQNYQHFAYTSCMQPTSGPSFQEHPIQIQEPAGCSYTASDHINYQFADVNQSLNQVVDSKNIVYPAVPQSIGWHQQNASKPDFYNDTQPLHHQTAQPIQRQPPTKKRSRTVFTSFQLGALEEAFSSEKYLTTTTKQQLSVRLGLTTRNIEIWYQNRRSRKD